MTNINKLLAADHDAYFMHRGGITSENIGAYGQPVECHKAYKDIDRELLAQIIDWFAKANKDEVDAKKIKTQSWLGRLARINTSTVSQILSGKYPSSPSKQLKALLTAIEDYERQQKASSAMSYIRTGIYRSIASACQRATSVSSFAIVSGYVGVGKTSAVKEYARINEHTYVIEANPSMTVSVLLDEIMSALKIGIHERFGRSRTMDARFMSIVYELRGTISTLIIDEAETMNRQCLHFLRRIRDKASIGVVLVGTERLHSLIAPEHGEFDQIRSRVALWLPIIKQITRDDSDALAQAALNLEDVGELSQEVLDALWKYGKGSARMLLENLIPAIRDYGLKQGRELDDELVHQIAAQVLNLKH